MCVLAAQLAQQIAELALQEEQNSKRRNTTQIHSIPSMRAMADRGRLEKAETPKRSGQRIDLPTTANPSTPTASRALSDENPSEALVYESTTPATSEAASTSRDVRVSIPLKAAGFAKGNGVLSPLSEYVETEFVKSYASSPLVKSDSKGSNGASKGRPSLAPLLDKGSVKATPAQIVPYNIECKEEK